MASHRSLLTLVFLVLYLVATADAGIGGGGLSYLLCMAGCMTACASGAVALTGPAAAAAGGPCFATCQAACIPLASSAAVLTGPL